MTNSRRWIGTIAVADLAAWIPSVVLAQAAQKLAPARPNVTILATGGTIAGAQPKPGEAGYKAGSFSVESLIVYALNPAPNLTAPCAQRNGCSHDGGR